MSIVSGTLGAVMGSGAQEDAANSAMLAQTYSTDRATQLYNEDQARQQPFYQSGLMGNALMQSAITGQPGQYVDPNYHLSLTGDGRVTYMGPDGKTTNTPPMKTADFQATESPAAKYQLQQGTRSLNRALAARGLLGSGNAAQRLSELNTSVAANDWNQQYSRLLDMVKAGTGAAGSMGASSNTLGNQLQSGAQNLSNIYNQSGQARASLYSGLGGLANNALNTGINAYKAYNTYNGGTGGAAASGEATQGGPQVSSWFTE